LAELVYDIFSFCEEMSKQMICAHLGAFIRHRIPTWLEQKMQTNEKKSHCKSYDNFRAIQSTNKRFSKKNSDADGHMQRTSKQTKENRSLKGNSNMTIGSVGYSFLKQFDVCWFQGEVKEIGNADNCVSNLFHCIQMKILPISLSV